MQHFKCPSAPERESACSLCQLHQWQTLQTTQSLITCSLITTSWYSPAALWGLELKISCPKSPAALSRGGFGAGDGTFAPLSPWAQAIPLSRCWAKPWHETRAWLDILELTRGHSGFNASLLLIYRITESPELEVTHKDHAVQHRNSSCTSPIFLWLPKLSHHSQELLQLSSLRTGLVPQAL